MAMEAAGRNRRSLDPGTEPWRRLNRGLSGRWSTPAHLLFSPPRPASSLALEVPPPPPTSPRSLGWSSTNPIRETLLGNAPPKGYIYVYACHM
ncbi:unnamed protein product [Boreogadus saida]